MKLKDSNSFSVTYANSASTLSTARTINGTSFNGSANITTANWGTAKNITIGNTAKSVNGSTTYSWSLAEIGAVNKAGDSMSGKLTLSKGTINHSAEGTAGTSGYVKVAQFKITGNYQNQAMQLVLTQRKHQEMTVVSLSFASVNNTDPALNALIKEGPANVFIHKSATSTWDLYIQKTEGYDRIDIFDYKQGNYMSGVTVTWTNTLTESLPSGYVTATNKTSEALTTAQSSALETKINNNNNKI